MESIGEISPTGKQGLGVEILAMNAMEYIVIALRIARAAMLAFDIQTRSE